MWGLGFHVVSPASHSQSSLSLSLVSTEEGMSQDPRGPTERGLGNSFWGPHFGATVLKQEQSLQGGIRQCLQMFLVVTLGGGLGCSWHPVDRGYRDAAQHLAMPRAAPLSKNHLKYLSQHVSSTEAEKTWLRGTLIH